MNNPANSWDDRVRSFYRDAPFPFIDRVSSDVELREAGARNPFVEWLDKYIGSNVSVAEFGCGTGHLCHYLGLNRSRQVHGFDLSPHSIEIARSLVSPSGRTNVKFEVANINDLGSLAESYDVVLSMGVLHHLEDPKQGFINISNKVNDSGVLVVGLYHFWGRTQTNLRKKYLRSNVKLLRALDPQLRRVQPGSEEERSWITDQYFHPAETAYTYGEVSNWYREAGFALDWILPRDTIDFSGRSVSHSEHRSFVFEVSRIFTPGRDGGYFVVAGHREGQ